MKMQRTEAIQSLQFSVDGRKRLELSGRVVLGKSTLINLLSVAFITNQKKRVNWR